MTSITGSEARHADRRRSLRVDYGWLLVAGLVLIGSGMGLRDPWPADEPRYALIARDMVATGEWLVPRVGGDLYADKPPLYFWLVAAALLATRSLRVAFLLPSFVSALVCIALVYDLGRRLWNREVGLAAAVALAFSVQFIWQARQAQIDATLCLWTTLSLYGLLRHLLLGPHWRWYAVGWAAAGLGVITKGVGFLPVLVLAAYASLGSTEWRPRPRIERSLLWLSGPASFLAAVGVWLVPLLLAARADPAFAAYRDELLWDQTILRYTDAWHHRKPFWYFLVAVIPWLWLPLTILIPWLVPRWCKALRGRDLRIALLLSWVAAVLLFFSLSPGKRGVYILPALPAFVLASAPYLPAIARRLGAQRAAFGVAVSVAVVCAVCGYVLFRNELRARLIVDYGIDALAPVTVLACLSLLICAIATPRRGFVAYVAVVATTLLITSFCVIPAINSVRSGAAFVARVEEALNRTDELGIIAAKEQYLLQIKRPIVHFGHARWRDWQQEAADAALWLSLNRAHRLVVDGQARAKCFDSAQSVPLGRANRKLWYLVSGDPDADCAARGDPGAAQHYVPPSVGPRE